MNRAFHDAQQTYLRTNRTVLLAERDRLRAQLERIGQQAETAA